jgi:hypothetical protein
MTSSERKDSALLARKARAIRDVWLREREEVLAVEISTNSEVRKGWKESDNRSEVQSVRKQNPVDRL